MDVFLIDKLAVTRLQQRCEQTSGSSRLFRVDALQAVTVSEAEWQDIGRWFRATVAPSARLLRWAIWLQVPVAIALLALILGVPLFRHAAESADAHTPGLTWPLLSVLLPLIAAARHNRIVAGAVRTVVSNLAERPRIAIEAPHGQGGLHAIEIVALVLFGPGTIIDLYGSLVPHAFDHTPWMGRQLGWTSIVGLVAFSAILLLRAHRRFGPG